MQFFIKFFISLVFILGFIFFMVSHYDNKNNHYVGSDTCQGCHADYYQAWKHQTLHPRIFRPVETDEDIQGDFSQPNPVVTFKKDEIEFVIGNKWEQVYVRIIEGEYYPFPAKWLITTQKWAAFKVDTWHKTPMSTQCNGCHTTGFNPDTYEFVEFGVGCEACHGAGNLHSKHRQQQQGLCVACHHNTPIKQEDIVVSVKSSICGQCHSRGNQKKLDKDNLQVSFGFPVDYQVGEEISKNYQMVSAVPNKNTQHWWGLGLSKNRHQEFADFSVSKHGQSLQRLKENHDNSQGELVDECLECHSADYIFAKNDKPSLTTAKEGITCVVCHEPHGLDRQFPSLNRGVHSCGSCHAQTLVAKAAKIGKPHIPNLHQNVSCVDCHMPYIIESGGAYPIRSHAFKIVPPIASKQFDMPNSCQNGGCHANKSVDWAIQVFDDYYPLFGKRLINAH